MYKKIAIGAVAVVVLFLATLLGAPHLVPENTYREVIEQSISKGLDARVTMESFKLRLLPSPGFTIEKFALISKQDPFRGLPIFSADKIEGSLSVTALLGKKIETKLKNYGATLDYRVSEGMSNLGLMLGFANAWSMGEGQLPATPQESPPAETTTPQGVPTFKAIPAIQEDPPKEAVPVPSAPPTQTAPVPPQPTPVAPSPTSFRMKNLIVRSAIAAESETSKASEDGYTLVIQSFEVVGGSLNMHTEGKPPEQISNKVELNVKNIKFGGKFEGVSKEGVTSADIFARGTFSGSAVPNASVQGKFLYDAGRKELSAKGLKLFLAGSNFSADVLVNGSLSPHTFDIHLATPSVNILSLKEIYPTIGSFLSNMQWQGTSSLDISAKGSSKAFELVLWIDATESQLAYADLFTKVAKLPFKISSTLSIQPESITIRDASFVAGQDRFPVEVEVQRQEPMPFKLKVSCDGISDMNLKLLVPKLSMVDGFEGLSASLEYGGEIKGTGTTVPTLDGSFKAKSFKFLDFAIEDIDVVFAKQGADFVFPTVKGKISGGEISGNGFISVGETTAYKFDGVVERLEAEKLLSSSGAIKGSTSLVVQATAEGSDAASVASNLLIAGSVIIPAGSFTNAKLASQIFSDEVWKGIESAFAVSFDQSKKSLLSDSTSDFVDFKAAYELKGTELHLRDLKWSNPKYLTESADVAITMPPKDAEIKSPSVRASVVTTVPKGVASQLLVDPAARQVAFDNQGRLIIPLTVGGNLSSLTFELDSVKLSEMQTERAKGIPKKVKEPAKEPAKESVKEPAKPAAEAATKPKPTAPKPAAKPKLPASDVKQNEEDVLKVIIGK